MEKPPKNNPDIVWVLSDRQRAGIGAGVILLAVIALVGSCVARNTNNNIPVPSSGEHSSPNFGFRGINLP